MYSSPPPPLFLRLRPPSPSPSSYSRKLSVSQQQSMIIAFSDHRIYLSPHCFALCDLQPTVSLDTVSGPSHWSASVQQVDPDTGQPHYSQWILTLVSLTTVSGH